LKNKKILIIGGTGFIGYHLAKFCKKKKWKVTSFSKNNPKEKRKLTNVKYLKGDILKKKDLIILKDNFDYVVNLGGYVDHSNKIKTYNSHYLGCKNLCDYFLKKNIKSFVQIGSGEEYGKIKSPHKEINKCHPKATYSRAKFLSSKYLIHLHKKYNFPSTVLRLYQAYGARQDFNRLIPIIIKSCIYKKKFPCSNGKQFRDFVHISDVVNAIIKAIKRKQSKGQILNLGTGKPINIKTLIISIRNKIGSGEPLFGKIKLRNEEVLKVYPEIKKIKKILNWVPKVDFNVGLNSTIRDYKNFFLKSPRLF
jgi:UDP-glucose 4-epimerase